MFHATEKTKKFIKYINQNYYKNTRIFEVKFSSIYNAESLFFMRKSD